MSRSSHVWPLAAQMAARRKKKKVQKCKKECKARVQSFNTNVNAATVLCVDESGICTNTEGSSSQYSPTWNKVKKYLNAENVMMRADRLKKSWYY